MSSGWPVRVAAVGPIAAGSALWRIEGQLMATVIVKASFAFTPDGVATPVAADPIRTADEHDGGSPTKSLLGARETAPQLHKSEVVLIGHAHAPAGASETRVRLCLRGDRGNLLDKVLAVYGDRQPGGAPQPFTRIRLGYERALGGIGFADNPIGTGIGSASTEPPNVVDPADPHGRVASFGPIPCTFPARKRLLGRVQRSVLEGRVAEIPSGFDWSYYQCAPIDQRVASLRGDEWLLLEGLTAGQRELRTRLPGARAVTRVYGYERVGAPDSVALMPDTLHIDSDAERLSIVWRGSFFLASENQLGALVVGCALELPGAPVRWPNDASALADAAGPAYADEAQAEAKTNLYDPEAESPLEGTVALAPEALAAAPSPFESTVGLSSTQLESVRKKDVTPFRVKPDAKSPKPAASADIPGAPWAASKAKSVPAPAQNRFESTAWVSNEDELQAARRKLEAQEKEAEAARREAAAEAEKKRAEAEQAKREADERRRLESERFVAEQDAAKREEERRAAELAAEKKKAAAALKNEMYGGFKRKK